MSLCSRLQQADEALRRAGKNLDRVREKKRVSRHEMAAASEALDAARTALDEVIALIKAQQVLPISSVEEVKLLSRFMPRFADRGALRRVVIRGSGNTYIREDASQKIRKALLAYGFLPCEQLFDLPRV